MIFENSVNVGEDFSELDGKVKTSLLLIEKDFLLKFGFSPIVARPRDLFTIGWFKIVNEKDKEEIITILKGNFSVENGLYKVDLKKLWTNLRT